MLLVSERCRSSCLWYPLIVGWGDNDRGVSYTFGPDVVKEFLHKNNYSLIVRAHQVVEDGYQFFAARGVR